jgi:hypothetical protein
MMRVALLLSLLAAAVAQPVSVELYYEVRCLPGTVCSEPLHPRRCVLAVKTSS